VNIQKGNLPMYNTDIPTRAELPTSKQLLRSTVIAIFAAAAILVTIVLPAEYAIDPTGMGRVLKLTEMGEIKAQLAEEPEQERAADQEPVTPASLPAGRSDDLTITLKPGEGTEVKLAMNQGARVNFAWMVTGGVVNFDLHGDGGGQSTSYEKGRGVPGAEGVLSAAFDGSHGWFWRNRGGADVTVTLKTSGAYSDIKRML